MQSIHTRVVLQARKRAFHSRPQQGFTLIELIVVLVILGILAAFAIPRFANVNADARVAAMQGLAGSLRSSSALVHGLALARNETASVQLEGAAVTIANGYPAASNAGIVAALGTTDGYAITGPAGTPAVMTFRPASLPTAATCQVTYQEAPANGVPVITLTASTAGC